MKAMDQALVLKSRENQMLLVHCTWQSNASDNIEKSNPQAETETEESPGGAGYSSGMFRDSSSKQASISLRLNSNFT